MKSHFQAAVWLVSLFVSLSAFARGPVATSLTFDRASINLAYNGTGAAPTELISLTAADGSTPVITLSDDPHSGSWLIYPAVTGAGSFSIGIRSGLPVGTYQTNLIATAPGYNAAEISISLTVTAVGPPQPRVAGVFPPEGSQGVSTNLSIAANDLHLPNPFNGIFGVANETVDPTTVRLTKLPSGSSVPATVNGTGGGDAINLTPLLPLEPNTTYRFTIDGVTDLTGSPFELFHTTFTTGGSGGTTGGDLDNVAFTSGGSVASGENYTSLSIGPDGKFYGLAISGTIHRWDIAGDGTLTNRQTISTLTNTYGSRSAIGLTFAPTATAQNLVVYVTHCSGGLDNAPAWDGRLSRLSGPNLEQEKLIVTNLPRSRRDHLTNSIAFRPGEDRVLYFLQGSNTAGGAPDNAWGNRMERLLSASVLRLDLTKLPEASWPLNAKTTMDAAAINAVDVNNPLLGTGLGTFTENGSVFPDNGTYNPYYVDAPLTLYATGIRNAYDLVWHSNGQLYVPANGTAAGSNSPASIDGTRRPDGSTYSHSDPSFNYPMVPGITGNNTQRDWLFRVDPARGLGYFGHPNSLRGQFVMNRGSIDVSTYPAGVVADANYRGAAYDFAYNKSPNGVIEYRSNAENGNLQGALLVCRYSGGSDLIALVPDGPDGDISTVKIGIPGFTGFSDPLDLTEDPNTGNLYVSDFGTGNIILLRPGNQATAQPAMTLNPKAVTIDALLGGSNTATVYIANVGNAPLEAAAVSITGADQDNFSVDASQLPATIPANSTASVTLRFSPLSAGPKFATLNLTGSNAPASSISLSGLGRQGTETAEQPSLQQILNVHRLGINVGDQVPTTSPLDVTGGNYDRLVGEEVDLQAFQRASDGPVEFEVLGVFESETVNPIVALGWYELNEPYATHEVLNVRNDVAGNGQTVSPSLTGETSFDPGRTAFGLYSRWPVASDRYVYSQDARNAFDAAFQHHVRVYPLKTEDHAFVVAFEQGTSGYEYQDLVVIVRNVQAAENASVVATPGELIFEATVNGNGPSSSTQTVTLRNEGTTVVAIASAAIQGPFASQFSIADPAGVTLSPGVSRQFQVVYAPEANLTALGHQPASLTFTFDGLSTTTLEVGLHGLKKIGYEGDNEPPLQEVVDALGYGIDVGWTTLANNMNRTAQGDEVITPMFRAAGPGTVKIRSVARYSPAGTVPFGWYTSGLELNRRQVGIIGGTLANAQTLFPTLATGSAEFNAQGNVFGIYTELTERGRFDYTSDNLNENGLHRTRIYPARDRDGKLLYNTFLVCFEEASNGDYQDNVFVLSNVQPAGDGAQVLEFSEKTIQLAATPGELSNPYANPVVATGGAANPALTLSSDQPWVVLPAGARAGDVIDFGVNAYALSPGNYTATVTARAPGYLPATMQLMVQVSRSYVYELNINFQDDRFDVPDGYVADYGDPFGYRTGGLQYGWIDPATGAPADNRINAIGKARGITNSSTDEDKILHSFNWLDKTTGTSPFPRHWEVRLPNGEYAVEVGAGEIKLRNSRHTLRVEGTTLIKDFIPEPETMLISKTGTVKVVDGVLTLDDIGAPPLANTKVSFLKIRQISGVSVAPAVTAEVDGLLDAADRYRGTARVALSARDRSNSGGIISLRYSLNGAAFRGYDSPIQLTHPGGTADEAFQLLVRAVDGRGNVGELDTVIVLARPSGAVLEIENMTKLPDSDESFPSDEIFSFHQTKQEKIVSNQPLKENNWNVIRLHNRGTAPLVISSLDVTDHARWEVTGLNLSSGPLTIAPGSFHEITAWFVASEPDGVEKIVFYDSLVIASNADNAGQIHTEFRGGYMEYTEGQNELTTQNIYETMGFGTMMGRDDNRNLVTKPTSARPSDEAVNSGREGDLVLAGYFEQADPNQMVRMLHLGAFHGFTGSRMQLHNSSNQIVGGMTYNHGKNYYQTILPKATNESDVIAGDRSNSVPGQFKIFIEGYRSTGGTPWGTNESTILGLRTYKARDAEGNIIPNAYICIQDYVGSGCGNGGGNCDWQDNVMYITNVRPAAKPTAGTLANRVVQPGSSDHYAAGNVFAIGYPGNKLRFSARLTNGSPLPAWIDVDPGTGTVKSLPPYAAAGRSYDIRVTATDLNLLTVSSTFRLTVGNDAGPCEVNANVDGNPKLIYCAGTGVRLKGYAASGIYQWTGPNGFTSAEANPVVTVPGTYSLASKSLSGGSCGQPATVTVSEDFTSAPALTINTNSPYLSCTVSTVLLTAESQSVEPTFIWSTSNAVLGTGPYLSVIAPGTYYLRAVSSDGCATQTQITITEDFTPASAGNGGSTAVCASEQPLSLFGRLVALGGDPQPGGRWTFFGRAVADTFDPAVGFAGTYTYTVGGREGCQEASSTLEVMLTDDATYYRDADGDGFGNAALSITACGQPAGYVSNGADCNDGNPEVHPGAREACDGIDNNCNGSVDEANACVPSGPVVRINAGGPATYHEGQLFAADQYALEGTSYTNNNVNLPDIYKTERTNGSPYYFRYQIPMPSGRYTLRLHFAEIYWGVPGGSSTGGVGSRKFDVVVEGVRVLNDYDITADVGAGRAVVKEFTVDNADDVFYFYLDARSLSGGVDQGKLSAIEIISQDAAGPNVAPVARATATPASGMAPLTVSLDGSGSTDANGSIVRYDWSWNGGSFTGPSGVAVFGEGTHEVRLTVTDNQGAQHATTVTVVVGANIADTDGDGHPDDTDTCPTVPNPDQSLATFWADTDKDGYGDPATAINACFAPEGYVANKLDNCPDFATTNLTDTDGDGMGDACDPDDDNDGVADGNDCAPLDPNLTTARLYYADFDGDGYGDPRDAKLACTAPANYVSNKTDNCPTVANPLQEDADGDGIGDACAGGTPPVSAFWLEAECAVVGANWNTYQDTEASNGSYVDARGRVNMDEPAADLPENQLRFVINNAAAGNYYLFGRISAADASSDSYYYRVNGGNWIAWYRSIIQDGTFHWNRHRNTVALQGGSNVLEFTWREGDSRLDKLHLGLNGTLPEFTGSPATNCDGTSGTPPTAVALATPDEGLAPLAVTLDGSASTDPDNDIVSYVWSWTGGGFATGPTVDVTFPGGSFDVTLTVIDAEGSADTDELTVTALNPSADTDGDGVPDVDDICPYVANPTQELLTFYRDVDGDGWGDERDAIEACSPPTGYVVRAGDLCPEVPSPTQSDSDGDGLGDACDPDDDNDGILDANDCNPTDASVGAKLAYYLDQDSDGFGDPANMVLACAPPQGYVTNGTDNCPYVANADQADGNGNGVGDACEGVVTTRNSYWLEAECAIIGSKWTTVTDASASGNAYSYAPGSNSMTTAPGNNATDHLRFVLTNAEAGNYNVFGRIWAPDGSSDSYWIRVNEGSWIKWARGITKSGQFEWNSMPGSLRLTSGLNVIDVAYREGNTRLDKLHLSLSSAVPSGLGAAADNCGAAVKLPPTAVVAQASVSGPAPLTVALDGSQSSDPDGTITSYVWNWAGGNASGATTSGTFAAGSYQVTLTVTDNDGLSDRKVMTVTALNPALDTDNDEVPDVDDNCPTVYNPTQELFTFYADLDGDGYGDPADFVTDCTAPEGYVANADDNCPAVYSLDLTDSDNDGIGDACDNINGESTEIAYEAECATVGSGWLVQNNATAANGQYTVFGGGNQNTVASEDPSQHVVYNVNVPEGGVYHVFMRLNAPNAKKNSLWVSVDGGPWMKFWKTAAGDQILTDGFEWRKLTNDVSPLSFNWAAGNHQITVANRESGTEMDRIQVSTVPDMPSGIGVSAACGSPVTMPGAVTTTPQAKLATVGTVSVEVYPNPVRDRLNIVLRSDYVGRVDLLTYDATGRAVGELTLDKASETLEAGLPTDQLPSGTYRCVVIEGDRRTIRTFVKLRQ